MYNSAMDTDRIYTPQEALRYYMENSENIDLSELIKNMAIQEPGVLIEFLEKVTGVSMSKLAGQLAREFPNTFIRRATFENRFFEATQFIIFELRHNKSSGKIPAIKKCREMWGFGLKEAKDIIDTVQFNMTNGLEGYDMASAFDTKMQHAYNKIMEANFER